MVMGLVMVGAIETSESPTTLDDVTPIARLTAEDEVVVVPAEPPYKTIKDLGDDIKARPTGRHRRRLRRRHRPHRGRSAGQGRGGVTGIPGPQLRRLLRRR